MKGWVGLVGWPIADGRLTHISGHLLAVGRAWDRESLLVKDQRSATVQCSQPTGGAGNHGLTCVMAENGCCCNCYNIVSLYITNGVWRVACCVHLCRLRTCCIWPTLICSNPLALMQTGDFVIFHMLFWQSTLPVLLHVSVCVCVRVLLARLHMV